MYAGVWYGSLVYAGYIFDPADLGSFTLNLNPCYDQAVGYAGNWYASAVYGGSPFCIVDFGFFQPPAVASNVRNLCIVRC